MENVNGSRQQIAEELASSRDDINLFTLFIELTERSLSANNQIYKNKQPY